MLSFDVFIQCGADWRGVTQRGAAWRAVEWNGKGRNAMARGVVA